MGQARSRIFDPKVVGTYHCMSRCVRRAYLCGVDPVSKRSFDHRKQWIKDRLGFLTQVFSIELISYVVMSNHLHTLIRNRPDKAALWSSEEVARRWRALFPKRQKDREADEAFEISLIAGNQELVELYRARLSNISWFNRCLCEPIARRSNQEDECTGRFWEGRFKCQKVEKTNGILACSAYIDLNPVRAGIATTPEDSDFTAIQDRIRSATRLTTPALIDLIPIEELTGGTLTTIDYFKLVDTTGRALIAGKAHIPSDTADILTRLQIKPDQWIDTISHLRKRFPRALGSADALKSLASHTGQQWFHGMRSARQAFI